MFRALIIDKFDLDCQEPNTTGLLYPGMRPGQKLKNPQKSTIWIVIIGQQHDTPHQKTIVENLHWQSKGESTPIKKNNKILRHIQNGCMSRTKLEREKNESQQYNYNGWLRLK